MKRMKREERKQHRNHIVHFFFFKRFTFFSCFSFINKSNLGIWIVHIVCFLRFRGVILHRGMGANKGSVNNRVGMMK